jgi:hypothetical protein
MYCPSCGKQIPENSTFCPHCGTRISASVAAAVAQPTHLVLSPDSLSRWRREFSGFDEWGVGKTFGEKSRTLLAALQPSFVPDDEPLVFDPGINSGEYRITEVTFQNIVLRDGFFFATESRLIFGNQDMGIGNQKGIALQIPYENIKAAYASDDNYTLVLNDGSQAIIRTKVPRPSLLGAVAVMGGSPADRATISKMERAKAEGAQEFVAVFTGLFTEIADENRRRRGSTDAAVGSSIQQATQATPQAVAPSSTPSIAPRTPVVIQKPWYRSGGCLVLAFLFATPIWSILILSDKNSRTWVKWVAGILLALSVIFLLISLSQH